MNSIKLDFRFTFFEKNHSDESDRVTIQNKIELFDFGSNNSYFLILSEHPKDLRGLATALRGTVKGNYCLLGVAYEQDRFFGMGINTDWLNSQVGYLSDLENIIHKVLTNWNNKYSLFTSRHRTFYKEYQRVTNQDLLAKSYFLQFFYFLVDDIHTEIVSRNAENFKEIDLQKIKEVEETITYDFTKATPSINEMAKMAGMSVSKFKNLFYELYGTTPHHYIIDKKMMYAKGLLQTGKYSITQVAYKVGYHHPSGFTRVYKQKFNYSPNNTYFEK